MQNIFDTFNKRLTNSVLVERIYECQYEFMSIYVNFAAKFSSLLKLNAFENPMEMFRFVSLKNS